MSPTRTVTSVMTKSARVYTKAIHIAVCTVVVCGTCVVSGALDPGEISRTAAGVPSSASINAGRVVVTRVIST